MYFQVFHVSWCIPCNFLYLLVFACISLYISLSYSICEVEPSHPVLPLLRREHRIAKLPRPHFNGSWIVLPFHPIWMPLVSVVRELYDEWMHASQFDDQHSLESMAPRVCWALGDKHLTNVLSTWWREGKYGPARPRCKLSPYRAGRRHQ